MSNLKKIVGGLVIFVLIVCGVGVLQTVGEKTGVAKSTEQGTKSNKRLKSKVQEPKILAKNTEQESNIKPQTSKPNAKAPKVVKIMNTKDKKMIEEVIPLSHPLGHPEYITWSPDENKIIYVLTGDGQPYGLLMKDLKTGKVSNVTDFTNFEGDVDKEPTEPDFSPDGKQITFVMEDKNGIPQVWKIDIDGKNKVQLTNFKEYDIILSPKWSPDGKKILVAFAGGELHFINPDGSGFTVVPTALKPKGGGGLVTGWKEICGYNEKKYLGYQF